MTNKHKTPEISAEARELLERADRVIEGINTRRRSYGESHPERLDIMSRIVDAATALTRSTPADGWRAFNKMYNATHYDFWAAIRMYITAQSRLLTAAPTPASEAQHG